MEDSGLPARGGDLALRASNAVDAISYIRLAGFSGDDFGQPQVRLDLVALRLSRWNVSFSSLRQPPLEIELEPAGRILSKISNLLEPAHDVPRMSGGSAASAVGESSDTPDGIYSGDIVLPEPFRSAHERIASIAMRRQKNPVLSKKVVWTVDGKSHLDELLDDLDHFITSLERAIPRIKVALRRMTSVELEEIIADDGSGRSSKMLNLLRDASASAGAAGDTALKDAVSEATANRLGHTYKNTTIEGNARAQQGHQVMDGHKPGPEGLLTPPGNIYENTKVAGNARIMQGNIFGGRSFWDS